MIAEKTGAFSMVQIALKYGTQNSKSKLATDTFTTLVSEEKESSNWLQTKTHALNKESRISCQVFINWSMNMLQEKEDLSMIVNLQWNSMTES